MEGAVYRSLDSLFIGFNFMVEILVIINVNTDRSFLLLFFCLQANVTFATSDCQIEPILRMSGRKAKGLCKTRIASVVNKGLPKLELLNFCIGNLRR